MTLLAVDTALGACSVAIIDGDRVLAHRYEEMARGHAEALAPMVEAAMSESGLAFKDMDRLGVTTGPGTFTGQRVGLAFMRGLRVALNRPLNGVTTLAAMAAAAGDGVVAAIHDAKRDEVYLEVPGRLGPAVMNFEAAAALLSDIAAPVVLAGTAAPAMQARLSGSILSDIRQPDALWVARLVQRAEPSADVPRPLYLRAPDAKLPAAR